MSTNSTKQANMKPQKILTIIFYKNLKNTLTPERIHSTLYNNSLDKFQEITKKLTTILKEAIQKNLNLHK